ncbi:aspartate/glutamate racemase family protein [Sedimentitalea sp. JM2-8]|uniref:Aspartate/glutamate racemase family protein n=1 Tax=Sedimentitalea xiamensis TaxID=3050037 RepID=A0ABT7FIS5_9RHOB|nr:aspartate/glutamate racemase family protein [Sedimentitalea xiamensis]MDK3074983.1 aspartate/glutamate racemase family protein [Sedimentitalea xiamensis]
MARRIKLALLNPNTNAETTGIMAKIARGALPPEFTVSGHTMEHGPKVVSNETELAAAAEQVVESARVLEKDGADAILVSGFGDPGVSALKAELSIPVTGIAEAGMISAAKRGRKFSIITTTEQLKASITRLVGHYGYTDQFASIRITAGDMRSTMANLQLLESALMAAARLCLEQDGAEVLLIGGGPLAPAARELADKLSYPIVEPVRAGALLAGFRAKEWVGRVKANQV